MLALNKTITKRASDYFIASMYRKMPAVRLLFLLLPLLLRCRHAIADISKKNCPTLEDLFLPSGALYEHNLNDFVLTPARGTGPRNVTSAVASGEEVVYTYSVPGDQDLWHGNPLSRLAPNNTTASSDDDDDVVGTSSGVCHLLPPDGSASQCLTVFTFDASPDDGLVVVADSIILSSYWPNDATIPGEMIIIGGTGCLEGATGTVSVIATDDTWEYFKYTQVHQTDSDRLSSSCSLSSIDIFSESFTDSVQNEDLCREEGEIEECRNELLIRPTGVGPSAANRDLWNGFHSPVGRSVSGACTWVSDDLCIGTETLHYDQYGNLSLSVFWDSNHTGRAMILGGTGCHYNDQGTMYVSLGQQNGKKVYKYDEEVFSDEDVDCDAASIDSLLQNFLYDERERIYIVSASGRQNTVMSEETGERVLWHNTPISAGGSSSGLCTLLPPGEMFFCTNVLEFSEDRSSITFMGLLPNKLDVPGTMAVVAGSGCFANTTIKSLQYTAKSVDDGRPGVLQFDYFTIDAAASTPGTTPSDALSSGSYMWSLNAQKQQSIVILFLIMHPFVWH